MSALQATIGGWEIEQTQLISQNHKIILNSDERSRLESLAREILDRVINHPVFSSYTDEIHDMKPLSCSIGITTHRASENISVDEMIKQADDLMYKVKSTSKGTYTFL